MTGFFDRHEYTAARTIRRFLHRHVATWQEWNDHELLDILEEWRDKYYEWRDELLDAEFGPDTSSAQNEETQT
jgi:hypothetical protein